MSKAAKSKSWTRSTLTGPWTAKAGSSGVPTYTYYVATTGSDSNPGTLTQPFLTPAYGASRLTTAGQSLCIRAGTYDVDTPTSTRSCAIYARANNCLITAYPGETVILRGAPNNRTPRNYGVAPTGGVIGCMSSGGVGLSGNWIQNLTVQGMVMFDGCDAGTRANRVERCDISEGGDVWVGITQGIVVWVEEATHVEIVNNHIHDQKTNTGGNNGMLTAYGHQNLVIEQNTFKNAWNFALLLKDTIDNCTIRRNFFYDNAQGAIRIGNNSVAQVAGTLGRIYQNIITKVPNPGPAGGALGHGELDDGGAIVPVSGQLDNNTFEVYNNVIDDVDGNYGDLSMRVGAMKFNWFNNIHSRSLNYAVSPYSASKFTPVYLDYNTYSGGGKWVMNSALGGTGFDSSVFADWKTYANTYLLVGANPDANSVTTDPGFLNGSGTWTLPTDFKRGNYVANGRGGSWPSVMGAYITGTEQIGADW